ncbi:short-chain dehydrogenase [Kiloniella spongiae]|uniref:Short-chain dehydrogenase n=1 Tax=Kiloniella spongiae TaxID=1489064 RepID=A0A0H2MZE3_9PROT|nr:SDR family oxidoreductase [Kiloniella spongiae]KLN62030.1 short-chain dehydrogenase [Kiloniella spongiae]
MKKILIIGATSAIAEATARIFALRGDNLFLLARDQERLSVIANDLKVRGANDVHTWAYNASGQHDNETFFANAIEQLGGIDILFVAHGILPDQKSCEASVEHTLNAFEINATSVFAILTYFANIFEAQNHGSIAVISSVAGDRGRQSNYVYGAAKGAVSIFLQGLRHRLAKSGVQVLTIKPGFVDTPMTASFSKGALWAKPEQIARLIVRALDRKKSVVYTPWFWGGIMLIIRLVPDWIFHKTRL